MTDSQLPQPKQPLLSPADNPQLMGNKPGSIVPPVSSPTSQPAQPRPLSPLGGSVVQPPKPLGATPVAGGMPASNLAKPVSSSPAMPGVKPPNPAIDAQPVISYAPPSALGNKPLSQPPKNPGMITPSNPPTSPTGVRPASPGGISTSMSRPPMAPMGGSTSSSGIKPIGNTLPVQPSSSMPPRPLAQASMGGVGSASRPLTPMGSPVPPAQSPRPGLNQPPMQPQSQKPLGVSPQSSLPQRPVSPSAPGQPGAVPPAGNRLPPSAPRRSILRFLPILLILLAIIGIGAFVYLRFFNNDGSDQNGQNTQTPKTEVTYWGLWEPTTVMSEVISEFEKQNPDYKITYVQQKPDQYRERLQTDIAQGKGPDIFRYHASWVPMMTSELSPLPEKIMTNAEFQQTFYPVAQRQLSTGGNIVGIPLMYEGLELFYNTQIFQVANVTPPKDWEEMKQVAQTLTVRSGNSITRAGIALGTANNVEHFSDILGLMLYQNKRKEDPQQFDLSNVSSKESQDALDFYVSFSRDLKVWNASFPTATETFARGDVAMMIAPSWRAHEIRAKNPNITFAVAPVPQIPGGDRVSWASYWAEGVSAKSEHKEISWQFLKYLSSADVQKKLHSDAKKERAFGELYSRVDLSSEQVTDPLTGAYYENAPYAKSWYLNGYTHDNGINDRIIKYYEDAVNELNQGGDAASKLETVQLGIQQVLQQYGLTVAPNSNTPSGPDITTP